MRTVRASHAWESCVNVHHKKTGEETIMTSMSEQLLSTKTSSRPARSGPAESRQKRATTGPGSDRARPASAGSEFPDSIGAHRNVLAGLWAGKLLGLSGEDLTGYANSQRFLCMSETRLASMLEN